nr:unnamed protein product [Callosobruchus analis]
MLQEHSQLISQHMAALRSCENNTASLQNTQEYLNKNFEVTQKSVSALETKINISTNESKTTALTGSSNMTVNCGVGPEALEQFRRSHNILILGVPESTNGNEYVTGSVSATDRARPIKVRFASPAVAKAILQKINALSSHPLFKTVMIVDDKTPAQQKQLLNLHEELKRRRSSGEIDITIKYIKGTPKIVKSTHINTASQKN